MTSSSTAAAPMRVVSNVLSSAIAPSEITWGFALSFALIVAEEVGAARDEIGVRAPLHLQGDRFFDRLRFVQRERRKDHGVRPFPSSSPRWRAEDWPG
jgi:hypothetical protein